MWSHYLAYLGGGLFLTNAVPHFVMGVSGRPFQSPFAKPSGEGLSTSRVNVVWGFFNLVVGYLLVWHVGSFDVHDFGHVGAVLVGALLIGMFCAGHFGRFHGGNNPEVTK